MDVNIDELIQRVKRYTMGSVNPERFAHSMRTAQTAEALCLLYECDEKLGFLAGISHDMCKNMNSEMLISIVEKDARGLNHLEEKKPSLLHGRAAAVILERDFGIDNQDVIDAVRYHTFGKKGLCDLAKIVYTADKIELGRSHMTKEYYDSLVSQTLNNLVFQVLEENIEYLHKREKEVAIDTLEWYESLKTALIQGG